MLIRFDFENYKSYRVENSISLVSYTKLRTYPTHEKKVNSLSVLKYLGVYGNNATGKSTILDAMKLYRNIVCHQYEGLGDFAFKGNENEPTKFSAVFNIGNEIYQYSFSIIKSANKGLAINDEQIAVIGSGPRRSKMIYSKKTGIDNSFFDDDNQTLLNFIYEGYKATNKISNFETLFLSYATKDDRVVKNSKLSSELLKIYNYIKNNIVVIGANTTNLNFINREFVEVINKYITQFDKGLERVELVDLEEKEYNDLIPAQIRDEVYRQLNQRKGHGAIINCNNRTFVFVSRNNQGVFGACKLMSKHKYITDMFDFSEESEGTRKFITLMSYFAAQKKGITFFIDELERSMHPDACKYLFSFFENECKTADSQFIFTSHNVEFMKSNLRRDEIYFTDKDLYGGSIVYPQTDFKSVNSTNIAKKYLQGDYKKVSNHGASI